MKKGEKDKRDLFAVGMKDHSFLFVLCHLHIFGQRSMKRLTTTKFISGVVRASINLNCENQDLTLQIVVKSGKDFF